MKIMPIRYVADVQRSQRFYEVLGLSSENTSRPGGWTEMTGEGGLVALHRAEGQSQRVELCLLAEERLELLVGRLDEAGIAHSGITDENFGRILTVIDPDGLVVQIDEHDPELYT